MGPLVYTSGNPEGEWAYETKTGGFNGAAGLHQRKRWPSSTAWTPGAVLQWGRWFTPAETWPACGPGCRRPRFNGAAGLHQRKLRQQEVKALGAREASMGPLVYTSGNLGVADGTVSEWERLQWGRWFTPAETYTTRFSWRLGSRFNGAAGLHQRKRG